MTMHTKWSVAGTALAVLLPWVSPAIADEGEELFKSMQSAVHSLNYTGKLVFSKGSELSEYQIEHQPGQGNGAESVIKLDKGGNVTPDQQQFSLINSSSLRLPDQKAYSIDLGADSSIAGIPCKVVVVRPKDKMRYLHRYCISPDTGMLLRYSVMNREQKLLEQFMFTQLSIGEASGNMAAQQQSINVSATDNAGMLPSSWRFDSLPAGFNVHQIREVPGKANAHQVILSDGLTFVSLFIEPGNASGDQKQQVPASGATNILTYSLARHSITMVGEVPRETLQAIKNGLRYVAP